MTQHRLFCAAAASLFTLAALPVPAHAQEDANAATKAETERVKAQTELENAKANRDKAAAERIKALGLPSFDGKTTLNQGAGAMEATMLASEALGAAADRIASDLKKLQASDPKTKGLDVTSDTYIVLAGDEALDFGQVGALRTQIDAIRAIFVKLPLELEGEERADFTASAAIAAITAVSGLLRSDTEVTALDLPTISNRALATAVASKLRDKAILPSAAIAMETEEDPLGLGKDWKDRSLLQAFNSLALYRKLALDKRPAPSNPTPDDKEKMARHDAAIARYDAFFAKVTAADDKGVVPIAQAARLSAMMKDKPSVLRLHVDKSGGSLVNSKNLFTMLGLDPVKVSGGLVASYTLTDPASGKVLAADNLTCATTLSTLRPIQERRWRKEKTATSAARQPGCHGLEGPSTKKA